MDSEVGATSVASDDTDRVWCHDCRSTLVVPAAALTVDEPECPACYGPFIEVLDPAEPSRAPQAARAAPGSDAIGTTSEGGAGGNDGNVHIELGDDARPEHVIAATRRILQHLTMGPTAEVDLAGVGRGGLGVDATCDAYPLHLVHGAANDPSETLHAARGFER